MQSHNCSIDTTHVPLLFHLTIPLTYALRSPQEAPVSGEPQPEDMSLTLTQSRMSGLDSLTGSGLAREAQAVAANFQIQVPHTQQEQSERGSEQ